MVSDDRKFLYEDKRWLQDEWRPNMDVYLENYHRAIEFYLMTALTVINRKTDANINVFNMTGRCRCEILEAATYARKYFVDDILILEIEDINTPLQHGYKIKLEYLNYDC